MKRQMLEFLLVGVIAGVGLGGFLLLSSMDTAEEEEFLKANRKN